MPCYVRHAAVQTAARAEGVAGVLTAEDGSLAHSLAEPTAALVAAVQRKYAAFSHSCHVSLFHVPPSSRKNDASARVL